MVVDTYSVAILGKSLRVALCKGSQRVGPASYHMKMEASRFIFIFISHEDGGIQIHLHLHLHIT
jgi:hypothetical protein